jgi:predicted O-methyltransferase YrrM
MNYQQIISESNPSQTHSELIDMLTRMEPMKVKRILEIGVHRGGSTRVWKQVFNPTLLIGIDTVIEPAAVMDGLHLIKGKSQDKEVYDKVVNLLETSSLDFLFVDGSHYYQDVKDDFEVYEPLVRKGGVIAFHDAILEGNDTVEVYKFWNEIKNQYKTTTISHKDTFGPGATGVGLLWK